MSIRYIVREGLSAFRRAKLAAAGSVMTVTLSLLLLGMFYVISANTSRVIDRIRSKMELEAFLQEPATDRQIADLRKQILALDGVDSVRLITKEEAARIFKEEFGEDVRGVLDFNPLPPSLKIYLRKDGQRAEIAENISTSV